jgi:hypothetical protein
MRATTSTSVERSRDARGLSRGDRRAGLIRQASAWFPQQAPEPLPLQDLEESDAIRWVDVDAAGLEIGEVLALLDPICHGQLEKRMVRDLIKPERFAAGGSYRNREISITSAFRVRDRGQDAESNGGGNFTSMLEPVQLLVGEDWLLSCWHSPRVFRGMGNASRNGANTSDGLYPEVARRWPTSDACTAADLAALVKRELAVANGYRTRTD